MKFLGIILLNLCWAAAGVSCAYRLKRKCLISKELIEMCELMAIELEFSARESGRIVKRLCNEPTLSHLDFLKSIDFENVDIKTELDAEDNDRINFLFENIGKTDTTSMLGLIEGFKQNMELSRKRYDEYYKNHARLYVMFGIFGGFAITLVLI